MKHRLLLLPLIFLLAGCGRVYELIGTIVVLDVDTSTITEIVGKKIPVIGTPVAGAKVTLFHELDRSNRPVRDSTWSRSVLSDANGRFDLSDYATPGKANLVGVEVEAPGYETVFTTYVDYMDPREQYFLVILKRAL